MTQLEVEQGKGVEKKAGEFSPEVRRNLNRGCETSLEIRDAAKVESTPNVETVLGPPVVRTSPTGWAVPSRLSSQSFDARTHVRVQVNDFAKDESAIVAGATAIPVGSKEGLAPGRVRANPVRTTYVVHVLVPPGMAVSSRARLTVRFARTHHSAPQG